MGPNQGPSKTTRKRKSSEPKPAAAPPKRSRKSNPSGKARAADTTELVKQWPGYFQSVGYYPHALNTVLGFCSSRQNLATTFDTVRTSAEGLLKEPLDLARVAEIKALLPDTIQFAYKPADEIRINSRTRRRSRSPDFEKFIESAAARDTATDSREHILVLEFEGSPRPQKSAEGMLFMPPSMSPKAVAKLIEKRNEMFVQAVEHLIKTTAGHDESIAVIQSAGSQCIPVSPMNKSVEAFGNSRGKEPAHIPTSEVRPSIEEVLVELREELWYRDQIQHTRLFEAKEALFGLPEPPLSDTIQKSLLDARNIGTLYSHQAAAITALSKGRDVIVSTSTASGKSVIYQAPILRFLEQDRDSTAVLIYPTKALAQDQKLAFEQLLGSTSGLEDVQVATYDGDTPQEERRGIRERASIDTIHAAILPHEDLWRRFLKNLKLLVVDELHYYHDVHVAMVMRRLRRICAALGNRRIRFVSCSATIAKPVEHMKDIFGLDTVEEITEDGAPSGRRDFIIWDPPLIEGSQQRASVFTEATGLMRYLMKRGVRVIMFCKIRKSCELAMKMLRQDLMSEGRLDILDRVVAYRGGYARQDRRKIEQDAFSGTLLGIVATNALELGVDIGVLDAVIMLGFPHSVASLRQQVGRAGRRARDALGVLVTDSSPVDQYYLENPQELWDKPTSILSLNLDNPTILEMHLQCAAFEMPMRKEDARWFGPMAVELCENKLDTDKDGWYYPHPRFLPYPAKDVSLRGAEEEKYSIIDVTKLYQPGGTAKIIEELEVSRALFELYEGGIFIHQGLPFLVQEVSHDSKHAKLVRTNVSWITEPSDIDAVQTRRIREIRGSARLAYYGRDLYPVCFVTSISRGGKILDTVFVDMPPYERTTTGFWIDVSKPALDLMTGINISLAAAIHSAQHAVLNRLQMTTDIRTECKPAEKENMKGPTTRMRPARLIFYDHTGSGDYGCGLSARAFDRVTELLRLAEERVRVCECYDGCPRCIDSPSCKEYNKVRSKAGAVIVLRDILSMPIDVGTLPAYIPSDTHQTVIEAPSVGRAQGVIVESDSS
ncbi:DEAD/H helicase [Vararia minispora EC-137]|uniref:DEAD/H helicase n=1 Tax=Vararia minispora EC-137 TaxID=1314806 RepID=A0ACB8QEW9_9AGAM|nr:DEAD/H helicase [Vararia minispora EC-137]